MARGVFGAFYSRLSGRTCAAQRILDRWEREETKPSMSIRAFQSEIGFGVMVPSELRVRSSHSSKRCENMFPVETSLSLLEERCYAVQRRELFSGKEVAVAVKRLEVSILCRIAASQVYTRWSNKEMPTLYAGSSRPQPTEREPGQ